MKEYRVKSVAIGDPISLDFFLRNNFSQDAKKSSLGLNTLNLLGVGFIIHEIKLSNPDEKISNTIWLLNWKSNIKNRLSEHVRNSLVSFIIFNGDNFNVKELIEIGLNVYFLSNESTILIYVTKDKYLSRLNQLGLVKSVMADLDKEKYDNIMVEAVNTYIRDREEFIKVSRLHAEELINAWLKLIREEFNVYGDPTLILGDLNSIDLEDLKLNGYKIKDLVRLNQKLLYRVLINDNISIDKRLLIAKMVFDNIDRRYLIQFYMTILRNQKRAEILYEAFVSLKQLVGHKVNEIVRDIVKKNPVLEILLSESNSFP